MPDGIQYMPEDSGILYIVVGGGMRALLRAAAACRVGKRGLRWAAALPEQLRNALMQGIPGAAALVEYDPLRP